MVKLFLRMKEGDQGLSSVDDCVDLAILSLENYIQKSNERLVTNAKRNIKEGD